MKTLKAIIANIYNDKEITKFVNYQNYYEVDDFIRDAKTYIKAIKARRMLCTIKSVSSSGMSRVIKFNSFEGSKMSGGFRQYWSLFSAMGYKESKGNRDAFTVHGLGMDMVFHTNYTIIHRLGFMSKKEVTYLAQQTPTIL